jgi:hypothetical protein
LYLVRPELLADHDGEMIEDLSALSKLLLGLFGVQGAIGDPRGEVVPLLDRVSFERTVLQKTSQEFNENGYLVFYHILRNYSIRSIQITENWLNFKSYSDFLCFKTD